MTSFNLFLKGLQYFLTCFNKFIKGMPMTSKRLHPEELKFKTKNQEAIDRF